MRNFTVRAGKFKGQHNIYESLSEAKSNGITNVISPWYNKSVRSSSWVVSDDGFVIQCLNRYTLVNKRHKSGQYTDTFRFCNGTFWVYHDAKGRERIKNFYAGRTRNNKSSLGDTPKIGKYLTTKKKYFIELLGAGLDPYQAYIKAFKVSGTTRGAILYQIDKLLSDKYVRKGMEEQFKPVLEQVENMILRKTEMTLEQFIAHKVSALMVEDKLNKSARETRANLELMLKLFSGRLGLSSVNRAPSKSQIKEIEDAEFKIMAPPTLSAIKPIGSQDEPNSPNYYLYYSGYHDRCNCYLSNSLL